MGVVAAVGGIYNAIFLAGMLFYSSFKSYVFFANLIGSLFLVELDEKEMKEIKKENQSKDKTLDFDDENTS